MRNHVVCKDEKRKMLDFSHSRGWPTVQLAELRRLQSRKPDRKLLVYLINVNCSFFPFHEFRNFPVTEGDGACHTTTDVALKRVIMMKKQETFSRTLSKTSKVTRGTKMAETRDYSMGQFILISMEFIQKTPSLRTSICARYRFTFIALLNLICLFFYANKYKGLTSGAPQRVFSCPILCSKIISCCLKWSGPAHL